MEAIVKDVSAKIFKVNPEDIIIKERLMGGMSNYMYLIEVKDKLYTFRLPGEESSKFVDRFEEKENILAIEPLKLNNNTIYLDLSNGYKIAEFVVGKPLNQLDYNYHLSGVANTLKKLHNSNIKAYKDHNPLRRLSKYENYLLNYRENLNETYQTLKMEFLYLLDTILIEDKVFTHGDFIPANVIIGEKKIYLLDWEFAGNNDPIYDIASFGEDNFEMALKLLDKYYEKPTLNHKQRLYIWSIYQSLLWYNVAMFKHYIKLGDKLNVNFLQVADDFLLKTRYLFKMFPR